ncbi:hypothetical protein FRB96_003864 [Tulasnella sp. 330]|nr:hypothetical protein FRB96_003864 [Tulasnella sp. 330]
MEQHLTCLTSGDEMLINELFEKGASYRCVLAQLYSDKSMVKEGEAQGYRAMLVIEGANLATAVKGDCKACNNIAIRHLIVDGNRPALLRVKKGTALIELGNAENQIVQGCRLYDTRSWSTLHLREGDRMQCSGALIENNDIGPCGEEWDESYDGPSYGKPRWGQPWADGISLACKNSIVIHDATDGAIVIFGSSGSRVHNNTIYSRTLRVTGGINLVDHPPWEGDYTGVVVEDNVIEAIGAFVSVGIAIGPATWTSDIDSIIYGAIVRNNILRGTNFGYGIVVSSVTNFTVTGNIIDMATSKFSGRHGARCPEIPLNALPMPFLIHRGSSRGAFQEEFEHGEVLYIVCIEPQFLYNSGSPLPRRLRDGLDYLAFRASEDDRLMRVMRQLDELTAKVERDLLDEEGRLITKHRNEGLLLRLDDLEHRQKQIIERLGGVNTILDGIASKPPLPLSQVVETRLFSPGELILWILAALLGILLVTGWSSRWKGRSGAKLGRAPQ